MSFSVVILSKDPDNLIPCVESIFANEPDLPRENIIVVDDGASAIAGPRLPGITWLDGVKPFVFARNANIGIAALLPHLCINVRSQAMENDGPIVDIVTPVRADGVLLLNDDTRLQTPGGFSALSHVAQASEEYGVISAALTGAVGNPRQLSQGTIDIRADPRMVCFVAVYIRRRVFLEVGLLDEEFIHYGLDDDSFCLRARRADYKIGIFDGCIVEHGVLKSSYRGHGPRSFQENLKLFIAKYGVDNWGRPKETSEWPHLFP